MEQLQVLLLDKCTWQLSNQHFDNVMEDWCQRHYPVLPPTGFNANRQRSWDKPSIDTTINSLLAAQPDDYHRGKLAYCCQSTHSGDLLNALYPSLHVVFAWKAMPFVSLSVSVWVPVCVNITDAYAVTWLISEVIMAGHENGILGKF